MNKTASNKNTIEFGDFQTPNELASLVVDILAQRGRTPLSIVEPTCGLGNFLAATLSLFPDIQKAIGVEINPDYFSKATKRISLLGHRAEIDLRLGDFFKYDWKNVFLDLPEPILVIGNPPWVTAAQLGAIQSNNLPVKSNFQNRRGYDAITGKSNFDIAEWMFIHLLEMMSSRSGTIAMLLKQSVARKILSYAWSKKSPRFSAVQYCFDANSHFGVSVEACLLTCEMSPSPSAKRCNVFTLESPDRIVRTIEYRASTLLANAKGFEEHKELLKANDRTNDPYRWRSGVKHDCARVMEFRITNNKLLNGFEKSVEIEDVYLYPMLKGSAVANGKEPSTDRRMLVTQKATGEPTSQIRHIAPKTWAYLYEHSELLDNRQSSIYRKRPRYSVFGVGQYTFAPWKVAICGLYKKLQFRVVGPFCDKPVVFDDTVYFLPCSSEREAELIQNLLHSAPAQTLLASFIFWDSKRPVTAEVLGRLDLLTLASRLDKVDELLQLRPELENLNDLKTVDRLLF